MGYPALRGGDERMGRRRKGLARSETLTVRLDPKLRYLAELAGRKQRRTLSSFVEWAIEDSLSRIPIDATFEGEPIMMSDVARSLWDIEESDRFAKLGIRYPDLLNHEEAMLWKIIRECGYLWRGQYEGPRQEWAWKIDEDSLVFERLRESWSVLKAVASGEAEKSALPTWQRYKPSTPPSAKTSKDDDDIPF